MKSDLDKKADFANPIFDVSDLTYAYIEGALALDHVSMHVNRGEKLAIMGSNGSGKSTLLRVLDGLYFPKSGSIKAFGSALTEIILRDEAFNFQFRSRVGFVFQDSDAQLFMPTVWDEIAFSPLQLGMNEQDVSLRVEAALDALEIQKLRGRAPHQLSGGEKKRVALASVMSLMPEVWLLDEPSAGLDPRSVSWLVEFIDQISTEGKTVVLATHDLDLVERLADRVYVINEDHRLETEGKPGEIVSDNILLKKVNLIR
ncbi:MAG TPA: ABC transporter ATP-binding protein [Longilinea sp.]|nr:ABC transporter ATP-binding protein [Longilinea sp.]